MFNGRERDGSTEERGGRDGGVSRSDASAGGSEGDGGRRGSGGSRSGADAGPGPNDDGGLPPAPQPCVNSLDCTENRVCDRDLGRCVECATSNDCEDGRACVANRCRPPCASDNQCTPLGMLCGVDLGHCVDCTRDVDCAPSDTCDGGACVPRVECEPTTCVAEGKNCGTIFDGCGKILDCGTCGGESTCGGADIPNVCGSPGCTPTTCVAEGKNCGSIPDGCGNMLSCGVCGGSQTCGGSGVPNVCGSPGCTPTTCAAENKNCGIIPDGCTGLLNCGACTTPNTCAGAGVANVCGCTARTSCGSACGTISDGCAGTLVCPSCPTNTCRAGRYEGPATGTYRSTTGTLGLTVAVTAQMVYYLTPAGGTLFDVAGALTGISTGGVAFSATATGRIDCASTAPQPVSLSGGYTYNGTHTFTGTSRGAYDGATSSFTNGTWSVTESDGGGSGTWSANWVGN